MENKRRPNRYRSGVKNPEQEVHVHKGPDGTVVHIVDWEEGSVETLRGEEAEKAPRPS